MQIRISVRNFVEFLLRKGNIDNSRTGQSEDAMQEGSRIHRMIQRRMGSEYKAEVSLWHEIDCGEYLVRIEGRADGVIDGNPVVIDEIKSTYRDIHKMTEPDEIHLSQVKCYAYFYLSRLRASEVHESEVHESEVHEGEAHEGEVITGIKTNHTIGVRMTYCNIDTEEIRYFNKSYTFYELREWFEKLFDSYRKWSDYDYEWKKKRTSTAKLVQFPFQYREGQKELVTHVYTTLHHQKKLFMQAPTGVGKTIATLFPAIKAVGEGKAEKIFYLTAKTITRTVADQAIDLMRGEGLLYKSIVLTAKDKICFMDETECNPVNCPYARGHYDRINEAMYDLLINEDSFGREKIEDYARRHEVCPFEMGLDMSLLSDAIICDYNYLFDPNVYLKRFFSEGIKGEYIFLVDEAHNLVERGREMYSAALVKEQFLELKKIVKPYSGKMERRLEKCNKELLLLKKESGELRVLETFDSFIMALSRLHSEMNIYLEEYEDSPVRKEVLEFYFKVCRFLQVNEAIDDNYVTYTMMLGNGEFIIKEFCVNPSNRLKECMKRGRSTILFSATFLPIQYYKGLLGGEKEDYEVYAKSTFDSSKRKLLIGNEVTTKYTRRTPVEYYNIACYINELISQRVGNYMIFFPSHAFLEEVYSAYESYFLDEKSCECMIQRDYMTEEARESFLNRFQGEDSIAASESEYANMIKDIHMEIEVDEVKTVLGFCVLGGIFSEGIDLKDDRLIGAIIVGTGIPQVAPERELLKNYFSELGKNGFDYAYRFPGMNKVLQAAGRVIRTAQDIGVVALLDERFLQTQNQKLFPREWNQYEVVGQHSCGQAVKRFWDQWKV